MAGLNKTKIEICQSCEEKYRQLGSGYLKQICWQPAGPVAVVEG